MPPVEADPTLLADLASWLERIGRPGDPPFEPMAGDVSLRRYVRVSLRSGEAAIAAYYPPAMRDAQRRFDAAAILLESVGVRVPRRIVSAPESGWSLVEDLGPTTLYDAREQGWDRLEPALAEAVAIAARIASLAREEVAALGSPALDRELLRRELRQTEAAVLAPAGAFDDPDAAAALGLAFDALCAELAARPTVSCHRDFMARNLVAIGGGIAVLDFQDLRLGPEDYDLASLLNDSLYPPEEVEARLLEQATGSQQPSDGYRRAVAQRALKAAGTFATFAARGSDRHLRLVAPTLERASAHLLRLPETAPAWTAVLARCGSTLGSPERLLH